MRCLPCSLPPSLPGLAGHGCRRVLLVLSTILLAIVPVAQAWADRYAALVIDAATGEVFHEDNADAVLYPASLTKMMTLYLTFRALEQGTLTLEQRLPVSAYAFRQSPSRLGLAIGSRIRVEDAIYALVTKSANDIAVVLAEAIGGSEPRFAQLMTQQARRLGMTRTSFRNASGLPHAQQQSSARDMARLAQVMIRDFPQYYHYFSTESWRFRGNVYHNHNRLLGRYPGMDGLKTGFIRASGFNLVASAMRGRLRLIAVVFGGDTAEARNQRLANLLDQAFASRRGTTLIAQGSAPPISVIPGTRPSAVAAAPAAGIPRSLGIASVLAAAPLSTAPVSAEDAPINPPVPNRRPIPATASETAARPAEAMVPIAPSPPAQRRTAQRQTASAAGSVAQARPTRRQTTSRTSAVQEEQGDTGATGRWGIQVGAFRNAATSRQAIQRARAQLPGLLGSTSSAVVPVGSGRNRLYQARLLGLEQRTATTACNRLAASRAPCFTIAP